MIGVRLDDLIYASQQRRWISNAAATRYGYGALLPLFVVPQAAPILVPPDLVRDKVGLRPRSSCQACARRFGSQGHYRSAFSRIFGTRPRYPWDPQAVSDPWLAEEEFPGPRPPTAADRAQAQAAHEAQAKTARTVPLEFEDDATGEHFDVVQDGDLSPDPSAEPRNESEPSA